jgi:predicted double-glycine peptidase
MKNTNDQSQEATNESLTQNDSNNGAVSNYTITTEKTAGVYITDVTGLSEEENRALADEWIEAGSGNREKFAGMTFEIYTGQRITLDETGNVPDDL